MALRAIDKMSYAETRLCVDLSRIPDYRPTIQMILFLRNIRREIAKGFLKSKNKINIGKTALQMQMTSKGLISEQEFGKRSSKRGLAAKDITK